MIFKQRRYESSVRGSEAPLPSAMAVLQISGSLPGQAGPCPDWTCARMPQREILHLVLLQFIDVNQQGHDSGMKGQNGTLPSAMAALGLVR